MAGLTMAPNISGATGDAAARPQAQGQTVATVSTSVLKLMPLPSTLQLGSGQLEITSTFSVSLKGYTEPRLDRASQRFVSGLAGVTGLSIGPGTADASKPLLIATTDHASAAIQNIDDDESYMLDVTPTGATIHAATPLGTMHGFQTFLQLVQVTPTGFAAPSVHIQDVPRFPWRGLMIDSGRHFTSVEELKRNIDGMEAVKLNVFTGTFPRTKDSASRAKLFRSSLSSAPTDFSTHKRK
jgi:hexosaminidase